MPTPHPRSINVDYINPFIEATISTFQTMIGVVPTREAVVLKGAGGEAYGISGIIGLSGEATGAVVLTFPEAMAIAVVGRLAGEDFPAITSQVVNGVGELAGIIAGDAKNRLVQKGYKFELGQPKIVTGRSHISAQSSAIPCIVVSFTCELGRFCLEISLKKPL